MAKCAICEKGVHYGNNVSHSHRRSNHVWKSNIKKVSCKVNGVPQKLYVCTSWLRSGKVERTARRKGKSGTEPALYSFSLVRSTALWYDKCIHKAVHHEHRRYSHRSAVQAKFWSDFIQWADHAGADESIHNLHTSEQHYRPNGKRTASCMG